MFKLPLTLILLLGVSAVFAQTPITREKFSDAYSSAQEKANDYPRIHESKETRFSDGALADTMTWKWEHATPFKSRLVYEQTRADKPMKFEMISLEGQIFCKIDNADWFQTTGTCPVRVPWTMTQLYRMMDASSTSEFSVESVEVGGQKLQKYREFGKRGKWTTPSGKEVPPSTYESVFWVDALGRITKQEYKHTSTAPARVSETWIDTFTYLPTVTIAAPIK